MNERVETVLVTMPSGPVLVNLSDYLANPDAFGPLVDGCGVVVDPVPAAQVAPVIEGAGVIKATTPATEEPQPAAPAPTYGVAKVGKKQVVVDLKTGQPVALEGIDPEGYATAELAWSAIMALPASLPPTTAA